MGRCRVLQARIDRSSFDVQTVPGLSGKSQTLLVCASLHMHMFHVPPTRGTRNTRCPRGVRGWCYTQFRTPELGNMGRALR